MVGGIASVFAYLKAYHYNLNHMSKPIPLLLIFIAVLVVGECNIVRVPPISSDESLALRLDQITRIDAVFAPFGNLTHIYKKQVQQVVQGQEEQFKPCEQQPPETNFWGKAFKSITGNTAPHGLVYDFQKIQYQRNLVDMAFFNGRLYYVLQDGEVKTAVISSDFSSIKDQATHKTTEEHIAKGNFAILPNNGIAVFINHNQAAIFGLNDDSFSAIDQYEKKKDFFSAVALQGKYFAVAYGDEGMRIFSVNAQDKTLKVEYELNKDNSGLGTIDIRDISYDSTRKILFIVDHASGLLSLQLTFGSNFVAKLISSNKKIRQCTLVFYDKYNDELYLNCRELHKFRINNWPIIDAKVLPRQDIAIKEITATPNMVTLIGRDIFELLVADRKAAVYEDNLLDKLIITDSGNFISASEEGILIGSYSITPPTLRCSTKDASLLGSHRLVLKVTAECSQEYLARSSFQPGPLAKDDKCVYTIYKPMTIWQPAAINTTPFMVIGICLGLLGAGVLIWWGLSYLSFRKLKNYFDNYQNLEEEGRGTDRQQKKEGGSLSVSGQAPAGTNQNLEQQKKQEVEVNSEELHDIQ